MEKLRMVGHISADNFRSTQAIANDLGEQHKKDRLASEARQEAAGKLAVQVGIRLKDLKDRNLPAMAFHDYRQKLIAGDPQTLQKTFDPTHEDLLLSLKQRYAFLMSPLKSTENTAGERLSLEHEYQRSKRQLLRLREQGELRLQTS